jgi:MFS family permease
MNNPSRPPFPAAFYIALLALLLFALGFTMPTPIIPLFITDELSVADYWIGSAALIFSLASVSSRIPAGALADRQGRRRIMTIGAVLAVLAAGILAVSQAMVLFILTRILGGMSVALFTTANKAFATDLVPNARRGEAMGLQNAAFSLASIFSPLLGEGIKNWVSFQAVFILSAILALLALLIASILPEAKPDHRVLPGARHDIHRTLSERGIWASIVVTAGLAVVLTVLFIFYPVIAERKGLYDDAPRLLSSISMGLGLSIWALLDTAVEPLAGRLSDRWGRLTVAGPGLVITALALIAMSQATSTYGTYLALAVLAVGWGMTHAISDAISQDAVSPMLRGMGAAIVYTSMDGGMGVYAQILGGVIDGNDFTRFFNAVLIIFVVCGVVGLLLSRRLIAYDNREPAPTPVVISAD